MPAPEVTRDEKIIMEALYQLFISACQILAGVSLLAAMWAFYYAWVKEDEEVKFLGWRFLIIAATGALFGGVSYLCLHFPELPDWSEIALFIVPLLFMGIGFAVLHHHKRKWEAWLLLDDEMSLEG